MQITKLQRLMAYDTILVICLILAGYTLGIKIYAFTIVFIGVAFLVHSRLTRMLELKEEDVLDLLDK